MVKKSQGMWRWHNDGKGFREKALCSLLFLYGRIESKFIGFLMVLTIKFTTRNKTQMNKKGIKSHTMNFTLAAAGKWALKRKQRNSDKCWKTEETKANYGQWLHILFSVTGSCPFKLLKLREKKREQGNKKREEENKHSFFFFFLKEWKHVCSDYLLLFAYDRQPLPDMYQMFVCVCLPARSTRVLTSIRWFHHTRQAQSKRIEKISQSHVDLLRKTARAHTDERKQGFSRILTAYCSQCFYYTYKRVKRVQSTDRLTW